MNVAAILARLLPLRLLSKPLIVLPLFGAFFCAFAVGRAVYRVEDPDVFWIAAAGRDFWLHGVVPTTNYYGFADASHPWVMHEGLWAVLLASGTRALGTGFFALVPIVTGTLATALAFRIVFRGARTLASGALAGLVVLACCPVFFEPRPSYGSLAMDLAMIVLAFEPGWSLARAALAVALEIVWTNAHGSFPLGVVLLVVAALERGSQEGRHERNRWLATAAVASAATLVNPYGLALHGLVDRYVRGGDETARLIHEHIVEFRPLWTTLRSGFANPSWLVGCAVVGGLAVRSLVQRRRVARACLVLGLLAMGAWQVRHILLAVLLGAVLLAPVVDDALSDMDLPAAPPPAVRALVALPFVGCLVAVVVWLVVDLRREQDDWIHGRLGGKDMVELARELPDGAHVVAPFQASGVVLWVAAQRGVRVLFDPRNDCYGPEVALAGYTLEINSVTDDNVRGILTRFRPDYALFPQSGRPFAGVSQAPGWTAWRTAGEWTLFRRQDGR